MPTVTSRRAAPGRKVLAKRRELAEERLEIARQMAPLEARAEAIDARLKAIATDSGEPFKEIFGDGSYVHTSGAVAAEFKGDVPVIQTEAWKALGPTDQKRIVRSGLIKIEAQWGRATSGRVQVKIFGEAA
jgi:hypothetical protein